MTALSAAARRFVESSSVRRDYSRIKSAAVLHRAYLRVVVHMHDSETLRIPVAPLVVIQEGPGEVSAHVDALLNCVVYGPQMTAEVVDSERILNSPVDRRRRICESRSIFRDVDREVTVSVLHPRENVSETSRVDLPA